MGWLKRIFGESSAGIGTGSKIDSNRCCVCRRKFTDDKLSLDAPMGEVYTKKGLQCSRCGRRYCFPCMPTSGPLGGTKTCLCGWDKVVTPSDWFVRPNGEIIKFRP